MAKNLTLSSFAKEVKHLKKNGNLNSKKQADVMADYNILTFKHSKDQVKVDKLANSVRSPEQ